MGRIFNSVKLQIRPFNIKMALVSLFGYPSSSIIGSSSPGTSSWGGKTGGSYQRERSLVSKKLSIFL